MREDKYIAVVSTQGIERETCIEDYLGLWDNLMRYLSKQGDSVSRISPSVHCTEGSHFKFGVIDAYAVFKQYSDSIGPPARISVFLEADISEEIKVRESAYRIKSLEEELLEVDANQKTNYSKRETLKLVMEGHSDTLLFLL